MLFGGWLTPEFVFPVPIAFGVGWEEVQKPGCATRPTRKTTNYSTERSRISPWGDTILRRLTDLSEFSKT
jgi:hypothetical protein